MFSKWYNFWDSPEDPQNSPETKPEKPSAPEVSVDSRASAILSVEETKARLAQAAGKLSSFEDIYNAAGVRPPVSGFTVQRIIHQLLNSEHLRSQPQEVKRCAILVALESAGVEIEDIVQDAGQRERALNAYESVQQKALEEMEARKARENREIQAELERKTAEYNARIQANNRSLAKEKERFRVWQAKKHQEVQKMAETVELCVRKSPGSQTHTVIELSANQ